MSKDGVLVVGAGVMGAGIAQVAAQNGHPVYLYDQREGAGVHAVTQMATALQKLVDKGKTTADAVRETLARIRVVHSPAEADAARFAIEAIVESLEPKQALLRDLEPLLGPDAILATNTSSISITAIGAGLRRPERVAGMHFFNPVPVMKLVEVVSGLRTAPETAHAVAALAESWGKVPVYARSTPGFIVNRIARPYYAEALMLLQEQSAAPEALDALFRAAGFRMGPCELMDLIGHDTNYAVTRSVFEANFFDRRYTPSLVQRELVEGGLFGRKSGRGFYKYPEGAPAPVVSHFPQPDPASLVAVHGTGPQADALHRALSEVWPLSQAARVEESDWNGLEVAGGQIRLTDGRTAGQVARNAGISNILVVDLLPSRGGHVAVSAAGSSSWRAEAPGWLQALGWQPLQVADTPGLVVSRTLAMLVNEAADAVQQQVCTPQGADAAMKLGVNYPQGPFEWLDRLGPTQTIRILRALDAWYTGERYRVSPWLQHHVLD